MKLNHKFVRTVTTTAAVLGAAAMLSVGAFAAEADINDPAAAGYLPPQEQMVQGDIALHSADVAIGEKDPTYGGYGAPEGNPIQGNIMLISVSTLVVQTEKGSTTLNLSLLVEGQKGTDRVVLRRLGENTFLTVGLRCRRDLIVGR